MDYKIILGYLSVAVGLVSSVFYFSQVAKVKIKPHAFSWLIWSLVAGLGFTAQVVKHAGPGAWATGFTALANIVICALAFYKGDKKFARSDWLFLALALLACLLWWLTKDPTLSVILAAVTNTFGMIPTLRKGYQDPYGESLGFWVSTVIKWILALFAIQVYSLATWLYPAALLLANASVVLVLSIRRKFVWRH